MSSINEVVLEGYVLNAQDHSGKWGTATVVVDKYDPREKTYSEVHVPVVMRYAPERGGGLKVPDYSKLVDGKPVRFKGEISVRNNALGLAGSLRTHYLGKFEQKAAAPSPAAAPIGGGGSSYDDEPPFAPLDSLMLP